MSRLWFQRWGFVVWHVSGISRAWRYEGADGRYLLVTDPGGYDLPLEEGPYSAVLLSCADELIEYQPELATSRELLQWFRRVMQPTTDTIGSSIMQTANLGYPRMGSQRELKKAVEQFWQGKINEAALRQVAAQLREAAWTSQRECQCQIVPSNDFSFYDQVLDTTAMLGAVPDRFGWNEAEVDLETYFAMARGRSGVAAMEMTKWFDTNYHYLVPELKANQAFRLASTKALDEFREAKALGIHTRPVLIGPLTYLLLAKMVDGATDPLSLLPAILPVYTELLRRLADEGAYWVQIDEPILATDLPSGAAAAFKQAYEHFTREVPTLSLMLTTYFGDLQANVAIATTLPVAGLHVDLTRGSEQLDEILANWPAERWLSLGVVDGRNIWRCDLDTALAKLQRAVAARGAERLLVAPSCSLLHVPHDLDLETELTAELVSWLAFARQKLQELRILAAAIDEGVAVVADKFAAARTALARRASSPQVHRAAVRARCQDRDPALARRRSPFPARREKQQAALGLPQFPTTTIGSFPQTAEIRKARADQRAGRISAADYEQFLKQEIELVVREQERIGLDVLVHGEAERNDMVEYFGEQLAGFAFTRHGWVQSYGSRCVKPPIIYGDVERPEPMTVRWTTYAQSLTSNFMKGMLTGPVTILQWSFVRDDQPRSTTCRQIAFALRDEVADLEAQGIRIIQIDEPALREGLPLRQADWSTYLNWACESFRIASCCVADETQIHTHMCYAEFNDIMPAIAALDADVISLESSRSKMEVLAAFRDEKYPNEIGPGVYDIHSPRIPTRDEMLALLHAASQVLSLWQIWVNPDCGLKTRGWPEVRESLTNMVAAAKEVRQAALVGT